MKAPLLLVVIAACRFDGAGPPDPVTPDGVAPDTPLTVPDGPIDGPLANDAPSACVPISGGVDGMLEVPRLDPPTMDGDLSEWTSCFLPLDEATAGLVIKLTEAPLPAGRFSVMHDGTTLYLAAAVTGIAPLGNANGDQIYRNDGVALYVDADGEMLAPGYDPDAVQIIVDHAARRQAYRQGTAIAVNGLAASVQSSGLEYTVEIAVSPVVYGELEFAQTIGFDVSIDGGDGANQENEIIWHQRCNATSGCGCPNTGDAPWCNAQQFGNAHLRRP